MLIRLISTYVNRRTELAGGFIPSKPPSPIKGYHGVGVAIIKCKIYKKTSVIYQISTYFLKISRFLQIKPISIKKFNVCNNLLRIFKKYLKVSFVPICFQHLSRTNIASLPCLYYHNYSSESRIVLNNIRLCLSTI